jgi:signal transduction histidine kinase
LNIASDVSNIANVYMRLGQHDKAIAYVQRGLTLYTEAGAKEHMLGCLTTYAIVYNDRKMYDSSLHYLLQASQLAAQLQNPYLQNILNGNLAECYLKKGEKDKAFALYSESVEMSKKLDDAEGLAVAKAGLGEIYVGRGNTLLGHSYLKDALGILQQLGIKEQVLGIAEKLADSYEQVGDFKSALQYYKIKTAYNDSLQKDKGRRDAEQLLFNYEIQKKEDEIKLLQQDNAIKQNKNNTQLTILVALSIGLILTIIVAYLFFKNLKNERSTRKIIQAQKEEIEEQTHKLRELNTFKDNTFSVLSHDLRSPVNALTSTMMLLDENIITPEEFGLYKQELNDKLQSVSILLDNMLYWAQSQMKGQLTLEIIQLNVRNKVQKAFLVLSDAAKQKNIKLDNRVPADMVAFADKDQVDIVVRNLISNAIKFTHRSGEVVVSAVHNGNFIELSVTDNGVGMTSEQMSKLFNKTEHISTRGTGGEKGTGLGLQLCYDIMLRNHGDLKVSSKPGLGSVFTIILPANVRN